MALSPILVIGCGGSGGKVILGLRRRLEEELRRRGWDRGIPAAWQLIWIDVPNPAENHPEFGPPLPLEDYVALATTDNYELIDSALVARAQTNINRLVGWRPIPSLELPVSKGAGQMRAVGRSVALATADKIRGRIKTAFNEMQGGDAELAQLGRVLGSDGAVDMLPTVFVVSSMAGGTGAGIFMDVCDLARGTKPEVNDRIFGFLFTAEIFASVGADGGMAPNTVASLGELLNGFLSSERKIEPLYGNVGAVGVTGKSGPSWPFVIGMQPLNGGAPLDSPDQCYRALTETILASMTNEKFMQSFVNYQITNFHMASGAEKRLTAYQMLNQPRSEGDQRQPCGVLSSFGSAIVSVGTAKFGEWARDRLARSVLEHIMDGWEAYGRQLLGENANDSVSRRQVVDFLVQRERNEFISKCGLHEEDEPNGTQNNDVIDGIITREALGVLRDSFSGRIRSELSRAPDNSAEGWRQRIGDLIVQSRPSYHGDVAKAIVEGSESLAQSIVEKLQSAVSETLARYGVPVTRGLVNELRSQCKNAIAQLRADNVKFSQSVDRDTAAFVLAEFAALGGKKCKGNSDFVSKALAQATGPLAWYAMVKRNEAGIELIERVTERVITPLLVQLDDVGASLATDTAEKLRLSWPESAGGVEDVYKPSPTEKVLVPDSEWDTKFRELMRLAAGSEIEARSLIASGGFFFGKEVSLKRATAMVSIGSSEWWSRDGGHVEVSIALRPEDVSLRAWQWLSSEDHAAGKFIKMGLKEYLGEKGDERAARLRRFEEALTEARQLAQPLVRISPELMQAVHPGKHELLLDVACEEFPFPPEMKDARAIVERVMHGLQPPENGWFMGGNTADVEKRLITAALQCPVQPSTVTSLTEPIATRWNKICSIEPTFRPDAIRGFWTYNRARLLTEAIPLSMPSIRRIIAGWFVGRLLGLVTDPTPERGLSIFFKENGVDTSADLPWPLLYHRDQPNLHLASHQPQWLPAILEHVSLAMMLLGHNQRVLDGYERLYRLGRDYSGVIELWIADGSLPVSGGTQPQIHGDNAGDRKQSLLTALEVLGQQYDDKETRVIGAWDDFRKLPFGFELFSLFAQELKEIEVKVGTIKTGLTLG